MRTHVRKKQFSREICFKKLKIAFKNSNFGCFKQCFRNSGAQKPLLRRSYTYPYQRITYQYKTLRILCIIKNKLETGKVDDPKKL